MRVLFEEILGFRSKSAVVRIIKLTHHLFWEEYQVFETLA
jgi:hypothetical protein